MAKTIGGSDGMHMKPDSHPFQSKFRPTVKFAHTKGVGPNPGGDGNKISANSEMRKKRPMNGSGEAR